MDGSCTIYGREEKITVVTISGGRRSFGRPINWSGNLLVNKQPVLIPVYLQMLLHIMQY
jgi:hypothetical protein